MRGIIQSRVQKDSLISKIFSLAFRHLHYSFYFCHLTFYKVKIWSIITSKTSENWKLEWSYINILPENNQRYHDNKKTTLTLKTISSVSYRFWKYLPYLQWTIMGVVSCALLARTNFTKWTRGALFSGTPCSGQAVKLHCRTVMQSPC